MSPMNNDQASKICSLYMFTDNYNKKLFRTWWLSRMASTNIINLTGKQLAK